MEVSERDSRIDSRSIPNSSVIDLSESDQQLMASRGVERSISNDASKRGLEGREVAQPRGRPTGPLPRFVAHHEAFSRDKRGKET